MKKMINCLLFGMMTNHKDVFFIVIIIAFFFFFFTIYTALHCRFSFYGLAVLWLPVWCHLNHKNVLKEIVFTDFSDGLCMTMKMRDH